MSAALLAPIFALVLWSIVMLLWVVAVRAPILAKLDLGGDQARGGRGVDLEKRVPREVSWPAHNYTHLMEQPTIFYATVLGLAFMGQGTALNVGLAWGYVAIRVVHSIWQAKVNTVPVRASLFLFSTVLLGILAVNGLLTALRLSA